MDWKPEALNAALSATTDECPEGLQYVIIRGLSAMKFNHPSVESVDLIYSALDAAVEAQGLEQDLFDLMFLRLFNNIDAKTTEDHVDAFMDQNYAEAIHIDKRTNWKIVRGALIGAFKVAETRGYIRGRAEAFEKAAKVLEAWPSFDIWRSEAADAIRALAKEPPK